MKNQNKDFIVPVLIGIIALLVIGGGVYIYESKKVEMPPVTDTETPQSNQVQQTNTQTSPATVTLDLSSSFARQFKTILTEAFKKPANFNEHYIVAEIGCGTGCFTFVAIDKNTGKVYPAPIGNDTGQFTGNIGQPYSLHSNQIKIIAENGSKINTYTFTGSGFSLLSSENAQSDVSVKPSITVLSPNGGETWKIGQTYNITFAVNGEWGAMTIALVRYSDDSVPVGSTILGITNTKSFNYTVPQGIDTTRGDAARYKIEVYPAGARELVSRSKDYFSIMTQ